MNILIAPNAFKNSLNAQNVAEAIALGFKQSKCDCACTLFPVADGGDGTGSLLIKHLNGKLVSTAVHDALGRPVMASFGLVDNGLTAIIEMADASGIRLLKAHELDPLRANTIGTGELITAALDAGVTKIIIGMGGSATVDGGTGILSALGVQFLDTDDKLLTDLPWSLNELHAIDTSGLDIRILNCEVIILCDVNNKLLGAEGAAAVFGPQKGATATDVIKLDALLATMAAVVLKQTGVNMTDIKHSGTAGGAAAGMAAILNARLVNGAATFLELTGFEAALNGMDLVITGEGSIDKQTLQGKAPAAVAALAKAKNIQVIGLVGTIATPADKEFDRYFDVLKSINKPGADQDFAIKNTRHNLERAAREIGDEIARNK